MKKSTTTALKAPVRLKPEHRIQQIIGEAARFFAEHGFSASTPALAERLGIAQPLLYRYFRSKEEPIERAYLHASPLEKYHPLWELALADEGVPIRDRLVRFYAEYTELAWSREWLRLLQWASLSRPKLNARYYSLLDERIFPGIARALRRSFGDTSGELDPTERDLEIVRSLHGMMYHLGLRRSRDEHPENWQIKPLVEMKVDLFLRGATKLMKPEASARQPSRAAGKKGS